MFSITGFEVPDDVGKEGSTPRGVLAMSATPRTGAAVAGQGPRASSCAAT